jgi:hypothetical protein
MAGDADAEVVALRGEVVRLRDDLQRARDAAKAAELESGELRGELTEVYAALARARHIETVLRRTFSGSVYLVVRRSRRAVGRVRKGIAARLR